MQNATHAGIIFCVRGGPQPDNVGNSRKCLEDDAMSRAMPLICQFNNEAIAETSGRKTGKGDAWAPR